MPAATKRNLALEGLRGLLAMSVMLYHVQRMGAKAGWYRTFPVGSVFDTMGGYIVSIFFCISGYLIVQSLLLKADIKVFFRNRAVRIYPVFLTLHLIIYTLGPLTNYSWMGYLRTHPLAWVWHFFADLFFVPGAVIASMQIAQKNAWSLSYEMLFYIAAALLFVAISRKRWWITALLLLLTATVCFFRPLALFFLVGYGAFLLQRRLPRTKDAWLGWVAIPALILGVWLFWVNVVLSLMPVALVFYSVVRAKGWLSRLLETKPMLFLGQISYSLYLVHPFAMDAVRGFLQHVGTYHATACRFLFPVVGVVAALACSYVSYQLLERKLTRKLTHKWDNDRIQKA